MSDGTPGAGAVPANIFVSTDYESFKGFIKAAIEGFQEIDRKGKKTFQSLTDEMKDFVKVSLGGALVSAGKDFAETITQPFNTTFQNATAAARDYRRENTRIAVSVGQDWQKVGTELDDLAVKTRRAPEQLRSYAEQVKSVTGNWKTAKEGVETYSKLATYLGKKSVEELAPFAAEMEQTFGIKGKAASEEFFNSLISKAEKLGQNGQQAVAIWQRVAGAVGKETARGPQGQQIASKDAAMIPAMQKMGYSPDESTQIMGKLSSLFSGDLQWMERHFRAYGQLGKGEKLRDKYGRLTHSLPDLAARLRRTELARVGGSEERLQQRLQQDQNLGPLVGSFITQLPEFSRYFGEGQRGGDTSGLPEFMKPLGAAQKQANDTPEGLRSFEDMMRTINDRRQVGDPTLAAQDAASKLAPGGTTGIAQNYALKGVGIGAAVKMAEHLLGRVGLGKVGGTVGRLSVPLQMAGIATMSGDTAPRMSNAERAESLRNGLRRIQGGGAMGWLEEHLGVGDRNKAMAQLQRLDPAAARELAQEQAKAMKQGEPQRVTIVGFGVPPAPQPGGGVQNE